VDINSAFRAKVKALSCPACGVAFTDGALDWAEA
jgi:hypothetical protein